MRRLAVFASAFAAASLGLAAPAVAQGNFPSRQITMIVPAPPGGGTDVFGRLLAEIAEADLRQKVVVENRGGAGGTLGVTQMVAGQADGHTIAFVWNSPLTTSPHSLQVLYTPDRYAAVMSIGFSSYTMCVRPDFPADNGQGSLAHLKANPDKFTYGNDGVGGTMQLAAERIFAAAGVKVRAVPFGGAGETARNFLGAHVDIYGGSLPPILPHAQAGRAKCLLLTSADANPALPQAAGLASLGMAGEETVLWWGLIAPARTPRAALDRLEAAFSAAARTERFREAMAAQGATVRVRGAAETAANIRDELEALGKVARALGIERKAQ
ncbi:MAG: Bug family tripartite tricarboxylate transporter substrate binding protein [Tagaea sp.]